MKKLVIALIGIMICCFMVTGAMASEESGQSVKTNADINEGNLPYERDSQVGVVTPTTADYVEDDEFYGRKWELRGYNQNADPLTIFNHLKKDSVKIWHDAKVLNHLIADGETVVTYDKGFIDEFSRILFDGIDLLSMPIRYQWNNGTGSTKHIDGLNKAIGSIQGQVDSLKKSVKTNKKWIDALWTEEHSFNGITVRVTIDNISRKIQIHDLDGNLIEAVFIVKDRDLDSLQTKNTVKITTLAWNAVVNDFAILHCADVYGGVPVESTGIKTVREVELTVICKHLKMASAVKILKSPLFNFYPNEIKKMTAR